MEVSPSVLHFRCHYFGHNAKRLFRKLFKLFENVATFFSLHTFFLQNYTVSCYSEMKAEIGYENRFYECGFLGKFV